MKIEKLRNINVPTVCLLFLFGLEASISTAKFGILKITHITALVLVFLSLLIKGLSGLEDIIWWGIALIMACIYGVIAAMWNDFPLFYSFALGQFSTIIIFVFCCILFKEAKYRKVFSDGYVFGMMIICFLILSCIVVPGLETFLARFLGKGLFMHTKYGVRANGFYKNPNFFASAILIGVSLSMYRNKKDLKNTLWRVLCLGTFTLALFLTQSRSAYVAFVFFFLTYYTLSGHVFSKKFILVFYAGLILCIVIILFGYPLISKLMPQKLGRLELARLSNKNLTFNIKADRFFIYKSNLKAILKWPLGIGYTDTGRMVGKVTGGLLKKGGHNFILGYLLTFGIVFGWIFIIFWVFWPLKIAFYLLHRFRKRDGFHEELGTYAAGMISLIITNLAHSMFGWVYAMMFWSLGIGCYLEAIKRGDQR